MIRFIIEQLQLMTLPKTTRRYSPELIIIAFILYSTSHGAYEAFLRQNVLVFPSVRTLKRINKRLDCKNGLTNVQYLSLRASKLNNYALIDEIYLGQRIELSGGNYHGFTDEGEVAQTALCFMIRSLTNKFRDIVAIYTVKNLTGEMLYRSYMEVLEMLHKLGFNVVAIVLDNATPNKKIFLTLCGEIWKPFIPNPFVTNGQIYLIFDPTHNIKNLYNNFQKRRKFVCPAFQPILNERTEANFSDIDEIYEVEKCKPLKFAHKLNESVLNPKSIEKTNVKLALAYMKPPFMHWMNMATKVLLLF